MVEFSPATREARVRFPANAGFMFAVWAMSFWKWRLGHPGLVPSENTGPHLDPLEHLLVSIVVSIPACHAGDRGSIPRRGVHQALVLPVSLPGRGPKERLTHRWRCRGLNSGPHTCEACALPLSYIPEMAVALVTLIFHFTKHTSATKPQHKTGREICSNDFM